ncbi:hypothetical protein H6S82_03700 [Planktothrix sp. FACHB-1355]|uniref:Uncharacterized protein n=1 Tax=Aerosakkonema funiforme FACHB-1375 TaxID=2949571 RepID=A0A926V9M3_9CYAN|nr:MULTISPECIES: COP23 domain-containing protein [Oscillatoriales]MBD2179650.1 hypothetical protein [Aerosakkonema funiforme FACHB-1375]MBD3557961.1 hypothetical protein [Planktothrix sp. FACHB-1355]
MSWEKVGAIAGVIGVLIAAAGLGYAVATDWTPTLFGGKNDRFSCQLSADTSRGGEVWTVVYHHDKGQQPWLKMVNTFGDDWNTQKRCETISDRLEGFRKDGLIALDYRNDPNTPMQAVICAKTKLSPTGCSLVVTLKPLADGYESLRDMTEALRNRGSVEQSSSSVAVAPSFSRSSPVINLGSLLAEEDLKAGSGDK